MLKFIEKLSAAFIAISILFCACGSTDEPSTGTNKNNRAATKPQKFESSIFGRKISYDGFMPDDNIALPVEPADILDMLEIKKTLCFLTDDAVYSLDIETGQSNKLPDTDVDMFASYGDSIFTYSLESEKLCEYSKNGELISEHVIQLKSDDLSVDALIVTKDYYAFRCTDNSKALSVTQHNVFDRLTFEKVNSIDERAALGSFFRSYIKYKDNSILKAEDSNTDSRYTSIYEINLENGKIDRFTDIAFNPYMATVNMSYRATVDITYSEKTDTLLILAAPMDQSSDFSPYISEYSLSDPDNIVQKKFYVDNPISEKVFISAYENIVTAILADGEYRYFDYLNPPESITLACNQSLMYQDIINGFERETGLIVRTVSFGNDVDRLNIKLMAGDTDFDLFEPIYFHQHKYILSDMFEDLSKYEGLKSRLDGDIAAGYISKLDEKYVGIPTGISSQFNKDTYPEDGSPRTYSIAMSETLYFAQNIDITEGVYNDPDGQKLYKLLKFIYDNPNGNESKMPFGNGEDFKAIDCRFIMMNPSGTHKENSVKFLEYMFDVLNGDISGVVPENRQYIDIDSTEDVYIFWKFFAADYTNPILSACNTISNCDGKSSTIKEIARETAAKVRMRIEE